MLWLLEDDETARLGAISAWNRAIAPLTPLALAIQRTLHVRVAWYWIGRGLRICAVGAPVLLGTRHHEALYPHAIWTAWVAALVFQGDPLALAVDDSRNDNGGQQGLHFCDEDGPRYCDLDLGGGVCCHREQGGAD